MPALAQETDCFTADDNRSTVVLVTPEGAHGSVAAGVREALGGLRHLRLVVAPSAAAARAVTDRGSPVLILAHVADPASAVGAMALLQTSATLTPPVKVVVIGEEGQAERGLDLFRAGAAEYLERPLDLRRLALLVDVLTVRACHQSHPVPARPEVTKHPTGSGTVVYCPSAGMDRVMDPVRRVAPTDTTVMIQGETGTGKTRLARVVHDLSPRRDRPFLVVNCAALSATLIESEMFGHVKGAFTGADRNRVGKFAEAASGTLFLDEIDSLPPAVQAKLLRVVEDRVFEAVGSNDPLPMRARLIAASNRPLDREVEAGRFRADLFFRLNVVSFWLPPLRERRQLFPVLVEQFVGELSAKAGRTITGVDRDAMAALTAYHWPGNIRELRNAIERAVTLRPTGEIEFDDLPDAVRASAAGTAEVLALRDTIEIPALPTAAGPAAGSTLGQTRAEAEAASILTAIRKHQNNRRRVAAELGISRETLYKKLHRYGLFEVTAALGHDRAVDSRRRGSR